MIFTDSERAYLGEQRWARLATVQPDGTLQNSPVGYHFDADTETITVFGYNMATSRKFKNVAANGRVAFVVDDVPSTEPMRVRCLEIRGSADAVPDGGDTAGGGDGAFIRIKPARIISFGIGEDKPPHELTFGARTVG